MGGIVERAASAVRGPAALDVSAPPIHRNFPFQATPPFFTAFLFPCTDEAVKVSHLKEKGTDSDAYLNFVLHLYKDTQAEGVVIIREDYCDPYDFEYPILARGLEERGVPLRANTA